ncbi:glycoside hydrolase family protein [Lutibacter sp. TH_r2]|uniref:glycoside hydrolase family protein n=1 Tax=Lutibacter sp. TH_r2 TaxID=3082083 RepID=UPI00295361E1|nr:glycoside hydrolase family protein [Lutibacter sp. TH_r2]MDV7185893.1 glycoside hydrolase family protein [Lutibacter sp. TH_r2]
MKNYIIVLFIIVSFSACRNKEQKNDSQKEITKENFQIELGTVALKSKFENDSISIWGGSITKGNDGLYHMFYSRWKKDLGWVWETHSEIAHAVSESPFGPFKHKDIALEIRDAKLWDGLCTHNPTVHKFGDKYYLYYMGNTGDGKIYSKPGKIKLNPVHRNNQRIGVAVADSPNGPWKRFGKPLIDVSKDSTSLDALMTSNPSITQKPDGGYLMVYKAVSKKKPGIWGGPVVHCVATSDNPTGPFVKYDKPVFTAEGHNFPAEDPFIWYQDGKYRAIVKDMHGAFTDAGRALVLFESIDGFDWKLSQNALVSTLQIKWEDGTVQKVDHLERPQLYLENGKPKVLVCASDIKNEQGVLQSFNVQIPIVNK